MRGRPVPEDIGDWDSEFFDRFIVEDIEHQRQRPHERDVESGTAVLVEIGTTADVTFGDGAVQWNETMPPWDDIGGFPDARAFIDDSTLYEMDRAAGVVIALRGARYVPPGAGSPRASGSRRSSPPTTTRARR